MNNIATTLSEIQRLCAAGDLACFAIVMGQDGYGAIYELGTSWNGITVTHNAGKFPIFNIRIISQELGLERGQEVVNNTVRVVGATKELCEMAAAWMRDILQQLEARGVEIVYGNEDQTD